MGYYINTLQEGSYYELDGRRLLFVGKQGSIFYFHVCKMDDWSFEYEPTEERVGFISKELYYIKRVQDCSPSGFLKPIGRDRVFQR